MCNTNYEVKREERYAVRKNQKGKIRQSVLSRWVISYIIVLCIPLILSIGFSSAIIRIMEENTLQAGITMIENQQSFIDSRLNAARRTVERLTTNSQVASFQALRHPLSSKDHYKMHTFQQSLKNIVLSDDYLDDAMIYQKDLGLLISSRDIVHTDNLDYANKAYWGLPENEFYKTLYKRYSGEYLFFNATDSEGNQTTRILYALSLPLHRAEPVRTNLFISMDTEKIVKYFEDLGESNYFSSLVTKDGEVLLGSTWDLAKNTMEPAAFLDGENGQKLRLGEEQYIVCYSNSKSIEGRYFTLCPYSAYQDRISLTQRVVAISALACIVLSGVLIYRFSRHNYTPVKQLMEKLERYTIPETKRMLTNEPQQNEYTMISETLEKLLRYQEDFLSINKQKERSEQNTLLVDFLEEKIYLGEDELKNIGLPIGEGSYISVIIRIENYETLFFGESHTDDDKSALSSLIVSNITAELLSVQFIVSQCEHQNDVVLLLYSGLEESEEIVGSSAIQFLAQAKKLVKHYFGLSFHYYLGMAKDKVESLPSSYKEAHMVIQHNEWFNRQQAVKYNELLPQTGEVDNTKVQFYAKLLNCMTAGDFAEAANAVRQAASFYADVSYPLEKTQAQSMGLVNIFLDGVAYQRMLHPDIYGDIEVWQDELYKNQPLEELARKLYEILEGMAAAKIEGEEIQRSTVEEKLLRFVDEHQYSPALTITLLADYMDMGVSTVSKVFKQYCGVGFLEYIHVRRVERIKELLLETDAPLSEIAEHVGFTNDITMIRLFKKKTGITPGKYRSVGKKDL